MSIINLTQHVATAQQVGVIEPQDKPAVQKLLTFDELPNRETVVERAKALVEIAKAEGAKSAMVGGAPYLMAPLEEELRKQGIQALYAFSVRKTLETMVDGVVTKTTVFEHLGFVPGETV